MSSLLLSPRTQARSMGLKRSARIPFVRHPKHPPALPHTDDGNRKGQYGIPSPKRNINEIRGVRNTNHAPATTLHKNNIEFSELRRKLPWRLATNLEVASLRILSPAQNQAPTRSGRGIRSQVLDAASHIRTFAHPHIPAFTTLIIFECLQIKPAEEVPSGGGDGNPRARLCGAQCRRDRRRGWGMRETRQRCSDEPA